MSLLENFRRSYPGEESSSGTTLPLELTQFELPAPNGETRPNLELINKPARDEAGELKRLQSADKHLEGEDKRRFVEREIYRERDNYQTGRRFMKGLKGSYMVAEAGYQRMLGNDDKADQIQDRLNNPARQAKLGYLQKMANDQGDFHRLYLEEELEQTFVGDLAEGAGGVAGQIGMVTASGPLGFVTLTGQVTGQVYEGNYQRSYSERLDKELAKVENLTALTDEDFESIKSKAKEEAKEDAKNNIWSAVPELALDAFFLKGAGKLLKGKAGTTTDKLTTFTIGSLAEGSSEAVSSALQNYMVQRNIDPDQQLSEGVLYDFALGVILGTTVNTLSIGTGAGEGQLIQDVQGFRKAVLKRAKEDSKKGDEKAIKFLKEYSEAMERIHVSDGDGLKSVSVGAGVEKGMTPQQVLDAIGKDKDISESLPIHVIDKVENIGSIDESLAGKFTSEDGIEGLYVGKDGDKKVILVADQLGSVADVKRVLRHESIGHFGTEVVSGQMSSLFYERVGRDYVNTAIGRRIVADYSNDPNFSVETLGKEIVARVSENPLAPVGFKQSLIDAFHKVTGKKISEGPETDSQIIKAITLADQVLPTPLAKKLDGPVTSAKVDVQDDVQQDDLDNVLASRFSDFVRESASVKNFSSSQGTGRKYGIPKDFEAEAEALTAGKPGQLVKLDETHALYQEFHSVVDYAIYDPDTGERTSRKPKYFGFTKYEDPDSNSEALDKDGFPRKFVWAFQPLDNAYDMVETSTSDFDEALAFAESEDMDRRIDLSEEDPSLDDVLFSKKGNLPPPENSQATQRKGTLPTYLKAKDFLDSLKEGGRTLDYGAGLGLGAEAMGADSFEPNPRETFVGGRPTYDSSKQIPSNSYDKLVTANVLNVIPNEDGSRDKVVKDIGRVLAPGGVAMIQTRDVTGVMGAKTATPGPEKNSIIAKTEGKETFQKGFDKDELAQYVTDVLGIGFNVSKIPSSAKISGSAVLVEKDAKVMGAIKQANQKILFSKKRQELKAGITRDKMGNLFYKGKEPMEWTPEDFKEVGDIYGIKNFGGLSPLVDIKDPETGKTYKLPGGLEGKFTYYDMLWIKSNQPGINSIGEQTHAKITKKLAQSLTPEKVDKVEHFNRMAFGFLSPNAPLLPNEFGVARIFSQSMDDIQQLADMGKTYPPDANTEGMDKDQAKEARAKVSKKRAEWNKTVKKAFDIGAKGKQGGIGIGLTQDFSRLANFARLYVKDPDFFIKKADESWSDYVDKVSTQVGGFGTKTATFGGVWQDPYNAMISAIDRHMAKAFTKDLLENKDLKKRFSTTVVTAFNKELGKARKARTEYQKKLKKAKTDKQKQKVEEAWIEKQETIIDPSMREVKTLDGVMAQVNRGDADKGANALAKAVFATMTSDKPKYKTKGEVNRAVREEARLLKFIEEPKKFDIMSEAYRKALEVNERKAEELGIPVFPAQWTLWDRIRQRIEPHEVMFPGLHKLPRMGREQIAKTFNASTRAGYAVAPQPIAPTGDDPASLVYFSKKSKSPNPVTGESKFIVRLQYDQTLPEPFRNYLDNQYEVETHQEVLDSVRPWLRERKNKSYEQMANELGDFSNPELLPEQKVLLGQILIKRLGVESDALREKLKKRKKKGQMELDSIIDVNRKDDMAIQLAQKLAEYGRAMGRAVSMFQAFSALTARGRIRLAKRQIQNVIKAKVRRTIPELDQMESVLDNLIRVAQKAGFDAMSIEFFRKRSPKLLKLIEENFAPSLWGMYRKDAVENLHKAIMAKLNQSEKDGSGSSPALQKFVNELVSEIKQRADLTSKGKSTKPKSKAQILRDALLNAEKYADVWHHLAERTLYDEGLTEAQRTELQDLFGEIPRDPSGAIVRGTLQEQMNKFDLKLKEIARSHITKQEGVTTTIVQELMTELDLPRDVANQVAMQMRSTFNQMVKEEANKQLEQFKKKAFAPKLEKVTKGTEQFVVEMANLGAFKRGDIYDALAKRLGIKGFDQAFAKKVEKISEEIEKAPEGFQKNDKITDLMNLIQNQAGDGRFALLNAIRIANLVSGFSTQVVNFSGNLSTAIPMAGSHLIRTPSPTLGYKLAMNMIAGLGKGITEGRSVLATGRGRTGYEMEKYAFDPILERVTLPGGKLNPFNYLKYVHRFMSAMDLAFRFANIEGKATHLATMEGKRIGKKGKALRDYIDEALKNTDAHRVSAEAQASSEGLTGLNHKRRVNEILENMRDPDIKEESEQYGLRSTYQNVPEGILGALASAVAQVSYPAVQAGQDIPPAKQALATGAQFFIPFIRVVANVQNMIVDFTPGFGAIKAELYYRYGTNVVRSKGKSITTEQYKDLHVRHMMATAMAGALYYLFFSEEEDEENRLFDVTAGGPKNYQKKKTWMEGGGRPYTVRIAGVELGYKETPFGGLLAYFGGIKDNIRYEDGPISTGGNIGAGIQAYFRLVYDQAFFKGVSDFIDVAKADEQSVSSFKRMIKGGAQSYVVPNLFNQVDKALNDNTYSEGQITSLLGHYILPMVPFARSLGMPDLTAFGEPVSLYDGDPVNAIFDRVVRAQRLDPLLKKLLDKGIVPVKPNKGQLIRGKEEDEALSTLHRAQDLYLFNETKGRLLRHQLDKLDKSKQDENIESYIDTLSPERLQYFYSNTLAPLVSKHARLTVQRMSREDVERRLRQIKRKFDGPLAK